MADSSSACLFARIFGLIDQHVHDAETRQKLAFEFWRESHTYDFSPYQMSCDEVLMKLGLARRDVDPDRPEDGEITLYGPDSVMSDLLPKKGQRWRNKHTKRTCRINWITEASKPNKDVHYGYEETVPGTDQVTAIFTRSSDRFDEFIANFEKLP